MLPVVQIVDFNFSHLPGAYAVCLETSEPVGVVPSLGINPDLLGHVYVGPYLVRHPELASMVVDEQGVAGYFMGTNNSLDFWQWCEANWWPALREQYPLTGRSDWNGKLIDLLHNPSTAPAEVVRKYPAHFHIDFLPRAQGGGLARRLIDKFVDAAQVGVHLDVSRENTNAISVYHHLGFEIVGEAPESFYMGRNG